MYIYSYHIEISGNTFALKTNLEKNESCTQVKVDLDVVNLQKKCNT